MKTTLAKTQKPRNNRISRYATEGLGAALLFALFAGCVRAPSPNQANTPSVPLVWPTPPDTARIAYVRSFSTPADFGVKASVLARFGRWLTGSGESADALRKPFGLALDENDNLCITDTGANAVCYYDRKNKKWRTWSKVGSVRFLSPVAITRRNGTFFIADSTLGRIVAFGEDGKLSFQITNHLERPCAVATLGERLFVADSQRHCVLVFDLKGNFQKEIGSRGVEPGKFNFPTHLATSAAGELFVTDSMNCRVQIFGADGEYKGEIGKLGDAPGSFGRPKGIAVDNEGRVFAVDAAFDNLQIFDRQGRLLLAVGETGSQPGQFWLANGIAITRSNEIYVADSYNRRIQVFKYVGM